MKKKNIALAALLVLGSAVLVGSMGLVVVPEMKAGTAVCVQEDTQIIQEEVQKKIDQYTGSGVDQESVAEESLERTQEIVDEAREAAGLK